MRAKGACPRVLPSESNRVILTLVMVAVAQWQSTGLWIQVLRVQPPSATPREWSVISGEWSVF